MRRHLGSGLKLRRFLWIGFSAVTMGVLVYLLRQYPIFLVIGVGGLSYLAMVWYLPVLSAEEHGQILNLAGRIGRKFRLSATRG
jgi:hypothetical protein